MKTERGLYQIEQRREVLHEMGQLVDKKQDLREFSAGVISRNKTRVLIAVGSVGLAAVDAAAHNEISTLDWFVFGISVANLSISVLNQYLAEAVSSKVQQNMQDNINALHDRANNR